MTVRELYNWCKACRNKDAEVYMVKDWDQVDENGALTDLYKLKDINTQYIILDDGLDFVDVPEVLLKFEEERA
jgi:hypothetical protein